MNKFNLFYIFLTVITFQSCTDKLAYQIGCSKNISDSKQRHAFIQEYNLVVHPDSLLSTYNFLFKEIYVEKLWRYGRSVTKTINDDIDTTLKSQFHLICVYREEYMSTYSRRIMIIMDTIGNLRSVELSENRNGYLKSSRFYTSDLKDTLKFNVYMLKRFVKSEKLGNLVFTKKPSDSRRL